MQNNFGQNNSGEKFSFRWVHRAPGSAAMLTKK
jgi:hypothetical protein